MSWGWTRTQTRTQTHTHHMQDQAYRYSHTFSPTSALVSSSTKAAEPSLPSPLRSAAPKRNKPLQLDRWDSWGTTRSRWQDETSRSVSDVRRTTLRRSATPMQPFRLRVAKLRSAVRVLQQVPVEEREGRYVTWRDEPAHASPGPSGSGQLGCNVRCSR